MSTLYKFSESRLAVRIQGETTVRDLRSDTLSLTWQNARYYRPDLGSVQKRLTQSRALKIQDIHAGLMLPENQCYHGSTDCT